MTDDGDEDGDLRLTRRALVAAVIGGSVAGAALSDAGSYLDRFAPLSGSVWASARRSVGGEVTSPYGSATLRYDDDGVPHVEGESEAAVYYAVGYAHANDRLFQMDVFRRRMRGRLAELAGPSQVESDRFHRQMDFVAAAKANWNAVEGTETGRIGQAYVDGVNAYVEENPLPFEFRLAEYEPDPWTPVDTILQGKQIAWGLTGNFRTLRLALVREQMGADAVAELYPARLDHDSPVLRGGSGDEANGSVDGEIGAGDGERGSGGSEGHLGHDVANVGPDAANVGPDAANADPGAVRPGRRSRDAAPSFGPGLVDWLSGFESPPNVGSNNWVVAGEHTDTGKPLVANDPHLTLMAPPIFYEQHLEAAEFSVRGVTFPGVPFVVIGENHGGAWGLTNANADVIDFYEYETVDGGYRYRGETREFESRTETIPVSGGEDETVEVRKTVHGPYLERAGQSVGIAWTGLTATRNVEAVREFALADGIDEFEAGLRKFDEPTQNVVYGDRDGNILYWTSGKIPIRRIDGEEVAGDRVFDGSAGEAEWEGFEPYGESTWEGFVPFEEKPGVRNPDSGYVASANQRIIDDPEHYVAESYSDPFRAQRIYELLDRRIREGDGVVDRDFSERIQADTLDLRAERFADVVLGARDRMDDRAAELAGEMADWDRRMDRDSTGALAFAVFWKHFRRGAFDETLSEALSAAGLDTDETGVGAYLPAHFVVLNLPADSEWFDGDRAAVVARAMDRAAEEIDDEGWETYGDLATTDFAHPIGSQVPALNYPAYPTDGSEETVNNFHPWTAAGSSWRMNCPQTDAVGSTCIVPGGNSGDLFSEHYRDQLREWADVEYKPLSRDFPDGVDVRFGDAGDEG